MIFTARRLLYYLSSMVTLLLGVRNWPTLLSLLRGSKSPLVIILSDGTQYAIRSLMDMWIIKETNLDRDYERHGIAIQDGWNIVDIGAGLGDFTIFAARRASRGHVFAYEPAPDSVILLEQNLKLNGIRNVEVYPLAVANNEGTLSLDISGGVAVQYRTLDEAYGTSNKVTVHSVALADVLAGLPGGACDFLKMDCEGAEFDMLLNLSDASLEHVQRVCLEYHDGVTSYSHEDLARYFQTKGWQVRLSPSQVRRDLGFLYATR